MMKTLLKEVKLMSKLKALTLTILFAVQAVAFYMSHNMPFMVIAIIGTMLFLVVWTTKRTRDHKIEHQARLEREQAAHVSQPVAQTSKSNRLFVPPPLKEK
jgi:flagellar biosynthesis component FlhA